ncbi:hypothetical protein [Nonomuraea sp. NPDC049504]|uniref:hypothetical protein n=1 Tax=Nonomuraea sp. NPDC049504 TaxID=3154729 RepID=UPI003440E5F7
MTTKTLGRSSLSPTAPAGVVNTWTVALADGLRLGFAGAAVLAAGIACALVMFTREPAFEGAAR